MSSIKLQHSGGNHVTITAPSSNPTANRTITLPDGNGTIAVMQVVSDFSPTTSGSFSTTSTSYVTNSALPTLSITPSSSSSKIYVSAYIGMQNDALGQIENTIYRSISGGATTDLSGGNTYGLCFKGGTNPEWGYAGVQFVDSPNTTSQVTYTWYGRSEHGQSVVLRFGSSGSSITLMEIAP